eukprot:9480950-Pyramimonas_sp.AAC.3
MLRRSNSSEVQKAISPGRTSITADFPPCTIDRKSDSVSQLLHRPFGAVVRYGYEPTTCLHNET